MFSAALGAALLLSMGVSRLSLIAVLVACVLTTTSVLLFGRR